MLPVYKVCCCTEGPAGPIPPDTRQVLALLLVCIWSAPGAVQLCVSLSVGAAASALPGKVQLSGWPLCTSLCVPQPAPAGILWSCCSGVPAAPRPSSSVLWRCHHTALRVRGHQVGRRAGAPRTGLVSFTHRFIVSVRTLHAVSS